jgi:hypothetical protein
MFSSVPFVGLAIGIIGQFAAYLLTGAIEASLIPCCDDPTPRVPEWYGYISTPIHFLSFLLPAFFCGFYAKSRPVLVGTVAAGVGYFIWRWLGRYTLAQLFQALPLKDVGTLAYALSVASHPTFMAMLVTYSVCYAAAGAGAASGGYLLGSRRRPHDPK